MIVLRRVLFVCTANLQRSPTAEKLFNGWKSSWEAKSAGIMPEPGGTALSQELIDWAEFVIVMEPIHSQYIRENFQCAPEKIKVLNIADRYFREDPELIHELKRKVSPLLE